MARPNPAHGKLSCESSLRTLGGIAAAVARLLPGRCADIPPDVLPDVARPSRDRLAGLRAVFGELLASRKNLVQTRGKACRCVILPFNEVRLQNTLNFVRQIFRSS
jgi:hypothetical protein